jgi:hypothetical protein
LTLRKNKSTGEDEKVWTQGAYFNFAEGDVFYNDQYSYCQQFIRNAPVNHPTICAQIESAIPCKQDQNTTERSAGQVNLKIYFIETKPEIYHKFMGYKTMTQDEFVYFLISGPTDNWLNDFSKEARK